MFSDESGEWKPGFDIIYHFLSPTYKFSKTSKKDAKREIVHIAWYKIRFQISMRNVLMVSNF